MRGFILTLILAVAALFSSVEKAQAFDPVLIGTMAPVAMKAAQTVGPYIIRGFSNAGGEMLKMGEAMLNVMRLPLGAIQSTALAPWCLSDGMYNLVRGGIAPFELAWHAVLMPIQLFNVF